MMISRGRVDILVKSTICLLLLIAGILIMLVSRAVKIFKNGSINNNVNKLQTGIHLEESKNTFIGAAFSDITITIC